MKKILVAILTTALAALGLVAVSAQPASAACPYTACINTTTTVVAPAKKKRGASVPIRVAVAAPGNATPTGTVTVTVVSPKGKVTYTSTSPYAGGNLSFVTQTLKRKGVYTVTATFTPSPNSVFNGSSAATSFKIKKAKKKRR